MPFPSSVIPDFFSGTPGEIGVRVPYRGSSAVLDSLDQSNNVFGRAFTYKDKGIESVEAGGSGLFAGFLVNPKAHAVATLSSSTDSNINGRTAELCFEGEIFVSLKYGDPATIGAGVFYENGTGILGSGIAGAGQTQIQGANVVRHNSSPSVPSIALVRIKRDSVEFVDILTVLAKYGSNAHLWIPGVGTIGGIQAKNWLDTAGTIPVSLSESVAKVDDVASSTIAMSQSTQATRPVLSVDADGKYYWSHSLATPQYFESASAPFQMTDDACIVAGASLTYDALADSRVIYAQGNISNHRLPQFYFDNVGKLGVYALGGGATVNGVGGPDNRDAGPIVATMIKSGNLASVRRNGSEIASATFSGAYGSATVASIGAYKGGANIAHMYGKIYPVIVINGAVSSDDLAIIETWVASMSGVYS